MTTTRRRIVLFLAALAIAGASKQATAKPSIKVAPASGNGRVGEAFVLTGGGYPASATLVVTVGPASTIPKTLTTNSRGDLERSFVMLSEPLPAGGHAITIAADQRYRFDNAFTVRPIITLDPPIGDGRAGKTWRTDEAIAPGGYTGMVFMITGAGFPAGSFVAGDSIKVGKASTIHDAVRIGADGVMETTTVVIASNLGAGRHNVSIPHATGKLAFAAMFHVAPWAATNKLRRRTAARTLATARDSLAKLVSASGELLPSEELERLAADVANSEAALANGKFDKSEDISRQIQDKLVVLTERATQARKDKLNRLADVISSGFDKLQPPGAPPNRQAAKIVSDGRSSLEEARAAIERGDFDDAKTRLKASNTTLRKAQKAAGIDESSDQPVRW